MVARAITIIRRVAVTNPYTAIFFNFFGRLKIGIADNQSADNRIIISVLYMTGLLTEPEARGVLFLTSQPRPRR